MTDTAAMQVFPPLADPERYRVGKRDLNASPRKRRIQMDLFRDHFPTLVAQGKREAAQRGQDMDEVARRYDAASKEFLAYINSLEANPPEGRLEILTICLQRERILRAHGIDDPYRLAKQHENALALKVLPALVQELDAMAQPQRREAVIKGVFAGNIFDLGAPRTVEMFADSPVNFDATRASLHGRPWRVDDLDCWLARLEGEPHRAAVLFVDNAGPDIVLGMLPLARFLLKRGTRVILTANSQPSLNDVTYPELIELVEQVAELEPTIAAAYHDDRLRLAPSGNNAPLIDLRRISPELAAMVNEEVVDLVVVEGMGRALESNYDAAMTCDCLKLAMIKSPGAAEEFDAEIFDLVLRFEPIGGG